MKVPYKVAIIGLAASALVAAPIASAAVEDEEGAIGFALIGGAGIVIGLTQLLKGSNNNQRASP